MVLVEREEVLAQLAGVFADCVQGRGRVVHIGGPGASGKTALVRAFGDLVEDEGGIVLNATCSRAESMVAGGVLSQLLSQLPSEFAVQISSLLDSERPQADTCALLLEVAKARPVVLVADDVEFADAFTLQALLYLQRRIGSVRITLVLTESDHARQVNALFRAELSRTPWFTGIRLAPLSPRGVAEVVADGLGARLSGRCAPAYHAITGGNPLLVNALIMDYRAKMSTEDGDDGGGVVTGEAFRQAVLACLHRWDPLMLDVVRATAVLGENATPELLGHLLGQQTATVKAVLTALDQAGLLDVGRFRHPAVRAAVLGDTRADELAIAHQNAAALLYAEGLPTADVVKHLLAGGVAAPWAVGVLRDAADCAMAEHRIDTAIECLKLARTACDDKDETGKAALTAALAAAQWRATPSVVARHLPALHEAAQRGHLSSDDTAALLRYQLWHGRRVETGQTVRKLDDLDPPATDIGMLRDWLRVLFPSVAPAIDDHTPALARAHHDDLVAAAERVLRNCWVPSGSPELAFHALLMLAMSGEVSRAKHRCDALMADPATSHSPTWKAAMSDVRAHIALHEGDIAGAARYAKQALAALSSHDWGTAIASPLASLVLAASAMGKHADADAHLRHSVPVAVQHTSYWPLYLRARGRAHLAAGRPHAAVADFEACGEYAVRWRLDLPALFPWRSDLAEAYLRLGRADRAESLAREQLDLPTGDVKRARGVTLRVLASALDPKQRLPIIRESVALLQSCGDSAELAIALALLAGTHFALGELGATDVVAKRAVAIAESCSAEALIKPFLPHGLAEGEAVTTEEVDDETTAPATAHEPDDLASLSTAERRVAALAALGHTNREISRMLYITVSTVEQHLTRVYRKLKVRRRTDLANGLPLGEALDFWAADLPVSSSTSVPRPARDAWQGAIRR